MRYKTRMTSENLAKGMGWFSIGVGLAGILAHRNLCRQLGLKDKKAIVCAHGAREVLNGAAILASRNPAPWLWVRVAGDVIDLATLTTGLKGSRSRQRNVALAIVAVTAITALDIFSAQRSNRKASPVNRSSLRHYKTLSGFPRSPQSMRGIALEDFEIPYDQFDRPAHHSSLH